MTEAAETNVKTDAEAKATESIQDTPKPETEPKAEATEAAAGDAKSEHAETGANAPKAESGLPAPVVTSTAGIGPFIAAAKENAEAANPRSIRAKLLDYSAHAAIIVGLIGFAWTLSAHMVARPTAAQIEAPAKVAKASAPPKVDEMAELRRANAQMSADIKSLQTSLDSLRASVRQDRVPGQIRSMEASLESIRSGLSAAKSETNAAVAQLNGKLDKLQHEPQSKMQQLVDRLGKLEHQSIDTTSTGSIGASPAEAGSAKTVPTPPAKPTKLASAGDGQNGADDETKGQAAVISGWVVRDVYDGVALVQGRRGTLEVVPGATIPGAGVVKSIDRHGSGWTVTTTKGQLAYAAPPRDYRRNSPRGFYPGPGYPPYAY